MKPTSYCYLIIWFLQLVSIVAHKEPPQHQDAPQRLRSSEGKLGVTRKEWSNDEKIFEALSFENNLWSKRSNRSFSMSYPSSSTSNVVLEWNDVAMQVVVADYTKPSNASCTLPPPASTLHIALAHLAMYDALGSVINNGRDPYLLYADTTSYEEVSYEAAVSTAAYQMLRISYPAQQQILDNAYQNYLEQMLNASVSIIAIMNGQDVGNSIADAYTRNRTNDNSCPINMTYVWRSSPGQHQPDPLHLKQGIVAPNYGDVTPLVKASSSIELEAPPSLESENYAFGYNQVKRLGGDNITTPTDRTWQESVTAWFYAYDGAPYLGSPPVMMNQAARVVMDKVISDRISLQVEEHDNVKTAAYVLAQMWTAMADAGILTWKQKYRDNCWRPINAIRNGAIDGNNMTESDPAWTYLGAPRTNPLTFGQTNFDPAFPTFAAGHASFCAAAMKSLGNIFQTNNVEFSFTSWEWNGTTRDELGIVRPSLYQKFDSLSEFSALCGASRIWAGVHFCSDCQVGCKLGCMTADSVYENTMRWRKSSGKTNKPAIEPEIPPEEEVMYYLERKKPNTYFIEGKTEDEVGEVVSEYFKARLSVLAKTQVMNEIEAAAAGTYY